MYVKLCPQCGYQLARKAKRCRWCKSPVKKKNPFLIYIVLLLIFLVLVTRFRRNDTVDISLPSHPTQPQVVKVIKTKPSIKKPRVDFSTIYVRAQVLNLRTDPSLTSHTIKKLKEGQRLTQVNRSGNWLQVLADDAGGRPGWVHASLVGKTPPPPPTKAPSEQKAFKMFRKSFDQYNAQIKRLKGMTFFNDVEYLNQGVIQVTATDILLSAPKKYKEKYLLTLMGMWLEVRGTNQPATVRIVDENGHLRLEEIQNE